MKRLLLIATTFLLFSASAFSQSEVLVWSDEFDVDGAPNSAYWSYDAGNNNGWGNNEIESYTSSSKNSHVQGGILYLDAIKSNGNWSSARIKTEGKINFTYGRVQFRAQLPFGDGTWPAMWLLGESISTIGWPACGEIDVMEHVGKNPGVVQSALHTPSSFGNTVNKGSTVVSSYNTAFHTYEMNWTPDGMQFSIDGKIAYYSYNPNPKNNSTWPFNAPAFLILNIAMGGNLGSDAKYESNGLKNGIDPALTSAEMQLDYIRVYQQFNLIPLTGPTVVEKNQPNLKYQIESLPGATYSWTVPADAQITAGSGTNAITVAWGQTDGNVTLSVTSGGNTYQRSLPVSQVVKPQGALFPLKSTTFDVMWANNPANSNQYSILSQNPLHVDYTVGTKLAVPAIVGTFSKGLDLSTYPVLVVKAKTTNLSKTVNMRMDLVDQNGNATDGTPYFDFAPLIDDGEYYKYSFNFRTDNQWTSSKGTVDKTRITNINLYIDYGISGTLGFDSLYVDSLWVEQAATATAPNRPSSLSGTNAGGVTLSWNDNSDNETGFKIYRADATNGMFTEVTTVAPNLTTAVLPDNPANHYYKIRSYNTAGVSDFSNTLNPTDVITGLENKSAVSIYPNPTTGRIMIDLGQDKPAIIRVCTIFGTEVQRLQASLEFVALDLSGFARGIYLIEIRSSSDFSVEKVILQ